MDLSDLQNYLDPISPNVPTLPESWQHRLIRIPFANSIAVGSGFERDWQPACFHFPLSKAPPSVTLVDAAERVRWPSVARPAAQDPMRIASEFQLFPTH